MHNIKRSIYLLSILLLSISCTNNPEPWVDIFNGTDLEGWKRKGGEATYNVENGVIVGTAIANTPNTFLCTNNNYSDFILELEVKGQGNLNSGIQFRSNSIPDYKDGRVHGYQCEIDPSDRAWTGGIYDESRRGWIYPLTLNTKARSAYKAGEWNKIRIEAIGDTIRTYVNGISAANILDEMNHVGFIGLQVHSVHEGYGKEGDAMKWRNIRIITENPENYMLESTAPQESRLVNKLTKNEIEDGWELLFDGKGTENWRGAHRDSFPKTGWVVQNGELIVQESGGGEAEHGGDIVTLSEYDKFEIKLEFKITEGANSGIKYYVTEDEETEGSAIGLEYQILDDQRHPDAKLGNHEGSRTLSSLYDLKKAENKRFAGVGQWNFAIVKSDGQHAEHWLNNFKVLEYDRFSENFNRLVSESKYAKWENFGKAEKGHILLQDHGNRVAFRSIKIKTIK